MSRVRPILFNTEMVQAILWDESPKTETRRCIRGYVPKDAIWGYTVFTPNGYISCRGTFQDGYGEKFFKLPCRKDAYLYVRETWSFMPCIDCTDYECYAKLPVVHEDRKTVSEGCYIYRAGHENPERITWRPSIHMPKAAARIWLKVKDVRVENLQDITNDQILKEGIGKETVNHYMAQFPEATEQWVRAAHFLPFSHLWNSTIKRTDIPRYGWNANPWVWVIEFERCRKPDGEE